MIMENEKTFLYSKLLLNVEQFLMATAIQLKLILVIKNKIQDGIKIIQTMETMQILLVIIYFV